MSPPDSDSGLVGAPPEEATSVPKGRFEALRRAIVAHPYASAIVAGLLGVNGWILALPWISLLLSIMGLALLWRITEHDRRYRIGFVFGLAYFLPISYWLGQFVGRWTQSPFLGGMAWLFVAVGLTLPLALIVPFAHRLMARGWTFAVPLVWLALELFRSYVPVFAFPWGLMAHPYLMESQALLGAQLVTIYGSGALITAASLIFSGIGWRQRGTRWVLAIVLASSVFGTPTLQHGRSGPFLLRLGAYQLGIDLAYGPLAEEGPSRRIAVENAIRESCAAADRENVDLLVLPEGLISIDAAAQLPPVDFDGTLVFGGQRKGEGGSYQTAFSKLPGDGAWSWEDKTRLVIFGEFVPGRGVIPYPPQFALPSGDLVAGTELKTLPITTRAGEQYTAGPIVCFEALFPDIALRQKAKGAKVLTVMSLDDWFGGTGAPEWLAQASRWRAVETRLPLVRAGSMGLTEIVSPNGRIIRTIEWGERGLITAGVPSKRDGSSGTTGGRP